MKIAVKVDTLSSVPMGGNIYLVHPVALSEVDDFEPALYEAMGYTVVDVDEATGARLIGNAIISLNLQVEVAFLVQKSIQESKMKEGETK